MPDTLKTDYVNDVLDTSVNTERTYDIVDENDQVIYTGVKLRETTEFTTEGDSYGATEINEQNTFINGLKADFSQALTDLKATAVAQAVGATGSTFASVIAKLAEIVDRGAVSQSLNPGGSYTVPKGYHNGSGKVTAKSNTTTYTATTRGASLDMGATNLNRYVNTNGVPNTNSGTYNVTTNGTKDMGATNSYRYVKVATSVGVQEIYRQYTGAGSASCAVGDIIVIVSMSSSLKFTGGATQFYKQSGSNVNAVCVLMGTATATTVSWDSGAYWTVALRFYVNS